MPPTRIPDSSTRQEPVDLNRPNSTSHLSFGAGIHMCVGNQLARAELRLAFSALTQRLTEFSAVAW